MLGVPETAVEVPEAVPVGRSWAPAAQVAASPASGEATAACSKPSLDHTHVRPAPAWLADAAAVTTGPGPRGLSLREGASSDGAAVAAAQHATRASQAWRAWSPTDLSGLQRIAQLAQIATEGRPLDQALVEVRRAGAAGSAATRQAPKAAAPAPWLLCPQAAAAGGQQQTSLLSSTVAP